MSESDLVVRTPPPRRVPDTALNQVQRIREAVNLRLAGVPYAQIAERLGFPSEHAALEAVNRHLRKVKRDSAKAARAVEVSRLEQLLSVAYSMAIKGDLSAMDRCIKINERLAWLRQEDERTAEERKRRREERASGNVLTIGGDEESYIKALRQARGEL